MYSMRYIYIHVDLYPNQTRTFQFIQFLFACHWQFSCQLRHFNTTLLIIDLQKYLIQLSNGQLISFSSILQDLDIFENDKVILAFQIARLNLHSGREDGRQNYFHLFQYNLQNTFIKILGLKHVPLNSSSHYLKKQSSFSLTFETIILIL